LVVDDEDEVRSLLSDLLRDEGFVVDSAADGETALRLLDTKTFDLLLLDVTLGAMTGLDLLPQVRQRSEIPIIFVTGKGAETDRVLGLRMGADDYVVKPFSQPELVARVHSVLRRSQSQVPAQKVLDFDGLSIDLRTREVVLNGQVVDMTAKEFDLLVFLANAPRHVFSREQILTQVWGSSSEWQDPATVTEHIRRVRRKIEKEPDDPRWIKTVRGVGYRFDP
jgi:two-component system phosphate regulon response regulator PhoB